MKKHRCHSEQVHHALRKNARKITGPRRAILEALQRQEHPLTIKEIAGTIGRDCDPATIYRSIHMLQDLGIVQRFDFGDGIARFELVHGEEDPHHHHLICRNCARVVEIQECFPEELERKIAEGNGFAAISHKLEFFGVCPECQEERRAKSR